MPPKSGNEHPLGACDPGQTRHSPDPVFTADPAGGPPTPLLLRQLWPTHPTAASAAVARYSPAVPAQAQQGPSRPSSRTSMSTRAVPTNPRSRPEPIRFFRILPTASFVRQAFAREDGPPNRRVPRERRPPLLRQYHLRASPEVHSKISWQPQLLHSLRLPNLTPTSKPRPNPRTFDHPRLDDLKPISAILNKAERGDEAPN
ncbi:hypothetical protein GALMADRAFT_149075 [Galerina marginata CBS 339.88]|uniref:Uncharacterized protein n=1 Tax=Galerina marginata (strain CBS 339.88) TaxID=685588 RepID=A0A067SE36_GALM3|nr:hypothetical protein GALMADRAFT_149075 [Galerina marginata CBS 339.88]